MNILFLLASISSAFSFDINVENYKTVYKWEKIPSIIICKDSPVNKGHVEKAKNEWTKKGFGIKEVKYEKYNECGDKHEKGYILIMGDRESLDANEHHAVTIRWTSPKSTNHLKIITTAYTEIDKTTALNRPQDIHKLLTHELGHALGYDHNDLPDDIMSAKIMH